MNEEKENKIDKAQNDNIDRDMSMLHKIKHDRDCNIELDI